jgi:hypothetical protein
MQYYHMRFQRLTQNSTVVCQSSSRGVYLETITSTFHPLLRFTMFPSFLASVIFGDKSAEARSGKEPITTKTTERGSVNESGMDSYAFSGMQGWRLTMEDAHMVCTSIPVEGQKPLPKGHAIFGVMDGHVTRRRLHQRFCLGPLHSNILPNLEFAKVCCVESGRTTRCARS